MRYFICCHSKNAFKCFFSSLMCNSFSSIGMYFCVIFNVTLKYIGDAERTVERLFEEKEYNFTSCYLYLAPLRCSANREHVLLNNDLCSLPCFNNICSSLLLTREVIKLVLIVFGLLAFEFLLNEHYRNLRRV